MSSHHAFRRDLAAFAAALGERDIQLLAEEWQHFHGALHGHHTMEDTVIFLDLRTRGLAPAADLDALEAQHRRIDPLLDRADAAFASGAVAKAREVTTELIGLLAEHLDLEERVVIPHLRAAKEFPAPPSEEMLAMYADGFAWSSAGLADSVLERMYKLLPAALVAKIPAARAAFDARCVRVFGRKHTGSSVTSAPS
jgi:hypothetical protein